MTRINCIPPAELSDKHLLAEFHELPRVFTHVLKGPATRRTANDQQRNGIEI